MFSLSELVGKRTLIVGLGTKAERVPEPEGAHGQMQSRCGGLEGDD